MNSDDLNREADVKCCVLMFVLLRAEAKKVQE